MTLRPRLAAPTGELEERVTSGEQEEVNRHTQRWLAALLARADCRSRVHKVRAGYPWWRSAYAQQRYRMAHVGYRRPDGLGAAGSGRVGMIF